MVEVSIQDRASDEATSANAGILRIGKVSAALPNKFATTAELNATRMVGTKDSLPGEVVVSAKLMYPDTLKKILKEDAPLRDFARRLSREAGGFEDVARLTFLIFKGEASYAEAEDLRTLLDLQYFADMDVVTVQQASEMSPEDFASLLKFAHRWMDQKGIDKPIMPVIRASETQREFELFSAPAVKDKSHLLGVDMRGGFHYYTLRAIEKIKKKNPWDVDSCFPDSSEDQVCATYVVVLSGHAHAVLWGGQLLKVGRASTASSSHKGQDQCLRQVRMGSLQAKGMDGTTRQETHMHMPHVQGSEPRRLLRGKSSDSTES